ncbi:hypothetical protein COCSUDRAFT_55471 [Coccomyxa subellipsoidea C-169]|uniref:Spatacsin C-terminal domain-containing protein n=1 Tax=Coccomyxa subellipsoidea (strain C-169) TaxID=574566 RepID=I0Z9Z5_COCSC|nr:hypothetical protein COCSUDRAFT_55471 [Coccomyxa subellipsoidea C-169]EIE27464.1 hypothetical protein COCSUDRAFT_55471 [Coccomyxa subellipsoidea C-169]|eukprot:XP_005652008.1 hypothetical protein COCSUDRAFT_55471 [Coccomyxa subellipsoidea C-169]
MQVQVMDIVEDLIRAGQPLRALLTYLSNASIDAALFPSEDDAATLQQSAQRVCLACYQDPKVLASGVTLLALCKLPPWRLQVDVAVLRRIKEGLAEASTAEPDSLNAAAQPIADQLAKAVLSAEAASAPQDSAAKSAARQKGAHEWVLLRAFCEQHGLEKDASRMVHLAADNDWVHFLAEASADSYPYQQIVGTAVQHVEDSSLRHHLLHVLRGLAPDQATAPPPSASALPQSEGLELLDLLAQVGQLDDPPGALLAAALMHRWPMLALLAACHGCAPLRCLAVWLNATLGKSSADEGEYGGEGGAEAEKEKAGEVETNRAAAASALRAACSQGAFKAAIEAVQLFLPGCPLVGCLRFLQCGAGCRYREMETHLESLTRSMTPPPARRPGSAEGETEAAWVMAVTWSVADELLRSAASACERQVLLKRIVSLDLPVPGGSGSARYGRVHLLYELLGGEAEPFVAWPDTPSERMPVYADAGAALAHMLAKQDWQNARRWAEATGQQSQQVTLAQAAAVLADWMELAWGERLREGVWQDIHALFADKQLPPLLAARFLVEQAASLAISPREQFSLLQEALTWLEQESCTAEPQSGLVRALARSLQLLSARLQLDGQPAPLRAGPLIAPWAATAFDEEEADADSAPASRGKERSASGAVQAAAMPGIAVEGTDGEGEKAAVDATLAALQQILGIPGPKEITAAVRAQLEQGNVAGARALSRELASPPIEVVLVEAAVAIIRLCRPPGSAEEGQSVAQVVPAAVMSFLRRRGQTRVDTAIGVLEALQACAGRGAARPVCALAVASFRAATLLGMTCAEAARLGPRQSLQILLMKGPAAAPTAIEYAAAYQMSVEETADVLADAFLKGLLAAHHDARAESAAAWTPAGFLSCTEGLSAPGVLGSSLLAVLLERHGALPPDVEAGLLLGAHAAFEAGGAADALDVLVQLAAVAARAWAAAREWRPLVHLVAGLGQYQAVRAGMDLLVRADALELLLSKRAGSGPSGDIGVRLWRAAVLAAIQRQRPGDAEALSIAHHHFACTREMAAGLHARARASSPFPLQYNTPAFAKLANAAYSNHPAGSQEALDTREKAEQGLRGRPLRLQDSLAHLDAMGSALAAARAFCDAECGFAAADAARTAVRLGQQAQSPPR